MKRFKYLSLMVFWFSLSAHSAETDWKAASLKFIDETVVPAYTRFIDGSQGLVDTSGEYCMEQSDVSYDMLIEAYHQVADAWQGIQIYRSGPAQAFNRHSRIQTWPGVSKITSKQMRLLLAAEDESALEPAAFAKSSTALQGFPALERLLFAKAPLQANSYACRVTQTIAVNLRVMGEEMLADWDGQHKQQMMTAGETGSYLSSAEDVAAELLTDFYTQIYAIGDQKLGRPYAKTRFRPKRAESWRSMRSLRNIRENTKSAEAYYKSLFMPAMAASEVNQSILALFASAEQTGAALGDGFALAEENHAAEIQKWRDIMDSLRKMIQLKMPKVLNITIGFNALDGDG